MLTIINGCNLNNEDFIKNMSMIGVDTNDKNTTIFDLNSINLRGCAGCDACQIVCPGKCIFEDELNSILQYYLQSEKVVIVTNILFGSFNSKVKNFIDRTEPLFLPYQVKIKKQTRMKSRYDHYPELLIAGISENKDVKAEGTFTAIAKGCNLSLASPKVEIRILYYPQAITTL